MRPFAVLLTIVAVLVVASFSADDRAGANNPGTITVPLLTCPDVNGNGSVDAGDLGNIVTRFGATSASATYRALYDVLGVGSIGAADIATIVAKFGDACPAVDTEIARATIPFLSTQFQNENATFLATQDYYRASTYVPGQGVHYVHDTYFNDDIFEPAHPEGLVYDSNHKLVAQLYFIDGGTVGWGTPPPDPDDGLPPVDDVDIDAFCTPVSPTTACSWAGDEGWHVHENLCTVAIGAPQAAAIPGVMSGQDCEDIHNIVCGGQKCAGTTWRWSDLVGWMGHLWNHGLNANVIDDNGAFNGRFADCYPDGGIWKAHNCPQ